MIKLRHLILQKYMNLKLNIFNQVMDWVGSNRKKTLF